MAMNDRCLAEVLIWPRWDWITVLSDWVCSPQWGPSGWTPHCLRSASLLLNPSSSYSFSFDGRLQKLSTAERFFWSVSHGFVFFLFFLSMPSWWVSRRCGAVLPAVARPRPVSVTLWRWCIPFCLDASRRNLPLLRHTSHPHHLLERL